VGRLCAARSGWCSPMPTRTLRLVTSTVAFCPGASCVPSSPATPARRAWGVCYRAAPASGMCAVWVCRGGEAATQHIWRLQVRSPGGRDVPVLPRNQECGMFGPCWSSVRCSTPAHSRVALQPILQGLPVWTHLPCPALASSGGQAKLHQWVDGFVLRGVPGRPGAAAVRGQSLRCELLPAVYRFRARPLCALRARGCRGGACCASSRVSVGPGTVHGRARVGRILKRRQPKKFGLLGNVGPLALMILFCAVVAAGGTHSGLRKHGTYYRWPPMPLLCRLAPHTPRACHHDHTLGAVPPVCIPFRHILSNPTPTPPAPFALHPLPCARCPALFVVRHSSCALCPLRQA
jgi:hypothetical protein